LIEPPDAPPAGPPPAAPPDGQAAPPELSEKERRRSVAPPPPLDIDAGLQPEPSYDDDRSSDLASPIRRRPRSDNGGWGLLAGAFGIAAAMLGVAVALLLIYRQSDPTPVEPAVTVAAGSDERAARSVRKGTVEATSPDEAFEPSLSRDALGFLRETIAPYILFVRSDGETGMKSATGILADPQGLVAAPLSSVQGADIVVVSPTFSGRGERTDAGEESPGAVAVDRECDWLLIAARPSPGAPVAGLPKSFDKPPKPGDRVIVAGASDRGDVRVFETETREAPAAEAMDDALRLALKSRGWNVERFDWRLVSPVSENLRPGAAVLSLDGAWLGVVASRTPDGKALLIATGPELSSMFDAVGPPTSGFRRLDAPTAGELAATDPTIVGPDPAGPNDATTNDSGPDAASTGSSSAGAAPPTELAGGPPFAIDEPKDAVDSEEAEWKKAAEELSDLVSRIEADGLYAESLEDYLDLSDLAENVTTNAKRVAKAPESAGRVAWEAQRDRALELLASRPWEKDFAAAAHNEFAYKHVDAVKGIFFYGEVTAAKDEIAATGGVQPILFQAIGRSDQYVVDMTKNSDEFVKGSKWLVLATADPRMKISLRKSEDDPGTLCPILEAKYLIARPGDELPKKTEPASEAKETEKSSKASDDAAVDNADSGSDESEKAPSDVIDPEDESVEEKPSAPESTEATP
jgi:hypothetical protein